MSRRNELPAKDQAKTKDEAFAWAMRLRENSWAYADQEAFFAWCQEYANFEALQAAKQLAAELAYIKNNEAIRAKRNHFLHNRQEEGGTSYNSSKKSALCTFSILGRYT